MKGLGLASAKIGCSTRRTGLARDNNQSRRSGLARCDLLALPDDIFSHANGGRVDQPPIERDRAFAFLRSLRHGREDAAGAVDLAGGRGEYFIR